MAQSPAGPPLTGRRRSSHRLRRWQLSPTGWVWPSTSAFRVAKRSVGARGTVNVRVPRSPARYAAARVTRLPLPREKTLTCRKYLAIALLLLCSHSLSPRTCLPNERESSNLAACLPATVSLPHSPRPRQPAEARRQGRKVCWAALQTRRATWNHCFWRNALETRLDRASRFARAAAYRSRVLRRRSCVTCLMNWWRGLTPWSPQPTVL
jgi:hypothetical protein